MDLRQITDDFAVAPQIIPEDVPEIAKAGFRTVICNRPDGEDFGQVDCETMEAVVRDAGMEFLMLPIASGGVTEQAAAQFRAALGEMPGPILAYCRSGTRCTFLWSVARFGEMPDDEIVRRAAEAGYDVSGLIAQLRTMQGA